jgi:putative nucleotidyltransferase with HDIG domain
VTSFVALGLHSASVSGVSFTTDPASAEARATALLGAGSARLRHVAGVAMAAAALRGMCDRDVELLVAAAWLHDIGYAEDVAETGFHPLDGARYLRSSGAPDRLCCLVANHTSAWVEAEARGLADTLADEFPAEDSAVADALTFADLTTGPTGSPVSVEARLLEILERYEPCDVVHESIRQAAPDLIATVRRVEARLAAAQPR